MQQITVYGKPGCDQCQATTRKLQKAGVPHIVRDVTEDAEARKHIEQLGYRQVPVVEVGDQHWSGYRPDLIGQLR